MVFLCKINKGAENRLTVLHDGLSDVNLTLAKYANSNNIVT
jgi:hypothetical protein